MVQVFSSSQVVLSATNRLEGQATEEPVQVSATSQTPVEARHTKVAGLSKSVGQVALEPVQVSATSHTPALALHSNDEG